MARDGLVGLEHLRRVLDADPRGTVHTRPRVPDGIVICGPCGGREEHRRNAAAITIDQRSQRTIPGRPSSRSFPSAIIVRTGRLSGEESHEERARNEDRELYHLLSRTECPEA